MGVKYINPLENQYIMRYGSSTRNFDFKNLTRVLGSNKIFSNNDINLYTKFTRFGYMNLYSHEQVLREYLFFTKPDLNLLNFNGTALATREDVTHGQSSVSLGTIPYFKDTLARNRYAMAQLQSSCMPDNERRSPFMNILTNSVTSKLDLPTINADIKDVTPNIMGGTMQYRGHSLKSDNGFDFSLSFNDSSYLEIYTMAKVYDEYIRLVKTGEHSPFKKYIINDIDSSQFSIYKFLVTDDAETIMYWAKLTGCFFTDVPRGDFGDPTDFGNFSLNFHAQWVEDNNPIHLAEFNVLVSKCIVSTTYEFLPTGDYSGVNNDWVYMPCVKKFTDKRAKRRSPLGSKDKYYDYRLVWVKN